MRFRFEQWSRPNPLLAIARGLVLLLVLFVARRTLTAGQFVPFAQALSLGLVLASPLTGWTRAKAHFGPTEPSADFAPHGKPSQMTPEIAITAIGSVGSVALILAPTALAYNNRPDDMVASLVFAMAIYRTPYQLTQAMLGKLAAGFAEGRWMNTPLLWIAPIGLIAALFSAGLGILFGPWTFDFLVGDAEILPRTVHSGAAATTTVASLNLIGAAALIQRGKAAATVALWALPALVVAYPIFAAAEPGRVLESLELYVAMVYIGQLTSWSRLPNLATIT